MTDSGGSGPEHVSAWEYDWTETRPSTAVIEAVAAVAGCRPVDLSLLYEAIDGDALDEVVTGNDGVAVSFSYAAHEVRVTGRGRVTVEGPR